MVVYQGVKVVTRKVVGGRGSGLTRERAVLGQHRRRGHVPLPDVLLVMVVMLLELVLVLVLMLLLLLLVVVQTGRAVAHRSGRAARGRRRGRRGGDRVRGRVGVTGHRQTAPAAADALLTLALVTVAQFTQCHAMNL